MKIIPSVTVSIDRISCSVPEHYEIFYESTKIPNFLLDQYMSSSSMDLRKLDTETKYLSRKYRSIGVFHHQTTGNRLRICNQRKKHPYISPLFLIFDSSYKYRISGEEVFPVQEYFLQQHNLHLRPSEIHLAVDIAAPKGSGIHDIVGRSIRAGKKGAPDHIEVDTLYFGKLNSPSMVVVYNKAQHLRQMKGLTVPTDLSRIELKLKIPRLGNFLATLDDSAVQDWSFVYPKYFSLHQPNHRLRGKLRDQPKRLLLPLWVLKQVMEEEYGVWPSNFYARYLEDHPRLSAPVRQALSRYRWCVDSEKDKPP